MHLLFIMFPRSSANVLQVLRLFRARPYGEMFRFYFLCSFLYSDRWKCWDNVWIFFLCFAPTYIWSKKYIDVFYIVHLDGYRCGDLAEFVQVMEVSIQLGGMMAILVRKGKVLRTTQECIKNWSRKLSKGFWAVFSCHVRISFLHSSITPPCGNRKFDDCISYFPVSPLPPPTHVLTVKVVMILMGFCISFWEIVSRIFHFPFR